MTEQLQKWTKKFRELGYELQVTEHEPRMASPDTRIFVARAKPQDKYAVRFCEVESGINPEGQLEELLIDVFDGVSKTSKYVRGLGPKPEGWVKRHFCSGVFCEPEIATEYKGESNASSNEG